MDDIIIYSTSLQEHAESLDKVLKALHNFNLKIQLDESDFFRKETAFLGHIVTPEGVKPNPDKITKQFRIPFALKEEMQRNIEEMKEGDLIE